MWMFDPVDQSSPLPPVLPGATTVLLVDGRRMAVAGNSVGGAMAAVLAMMAKDRGGPKLALLVLFWPATDTNFNTDSYREFATGRFLPRAFMEFGWNIYAPDGKTRKARYTAPLEASLEQIVTSRSGA
jgi:acetyl esterase